MSPPLDLKFVISTVMQLIASRILIASEVKVEDKDKHMFMFNVIGGMHIVKYELIAIL